MRFELLRRFTDAKGKSLFGEWRKEGDETVLAMTAERHWQNNAIGASCIPEGFYVLERHNGTKYKDTFAFIGETVAHLSTPGVQRSACVMHWSATGRGLQGCVSFGDEVRISGDPARLVNGAADGEPTAIQRVLNLLLQEPGPHYVTIRQT